MVSDTGVILTLEYGPLGVRICVLDGKSERRKVSPSILSLPNFFENAGESRYTVPEGHPFGTDAWDFGDGMSRIGEVTSHAVDETEL